MLFLAAVLWAAVVRDRYERHLRGLITTGLSELFPRAQISIRRCKQGQNGTITLYGLKMQARDGARGKAAEVCYAERVELRGDLTPQDWLQGQMRLRDVRAFGVRVSVWPVTEERWSIHALVPARNPDRIPPVITIHDGQVRLSDTADGSQRSITLYEIQGRLEPVPAPTTNDTNGQERFMGVRRARPAEQAGEPVEPPVDEGLTGPSSPLGSPREVLAELIALRQQREHAPAELPGGVHAVRWVVSGNGGGWLGALQAHGTIALDDDEWELAGTFQNLQFGKALLGRLPKILASRLTTLQGLQATVDGRFLVRNQAERLRTTLQGSVHDGTLRDRRVPYRLDGLRCNFWCSDQGIQIRNLVGTAGDASIELNADLDGWSPGSPMVVVARVHRIDLDQRLYRALPANMQRVWDRLDLSGVISGQAEMRYDGTQWDTALSIDCESVAMRPWLFPYPLTDVQGRIVHRGNHTSGAQLTGRVDGTAIEGSFSLTKDGEQWTGFVTFRTAGTVNIDEPLIAALTPRSAATSPAERFVRSLHAAGEIRVNHAEFRRDSAADVWHRNLELFVQNGRVEYEGFRYPIYNIRGRITAQDDRWWLHDFEGSNDTGRIRCSGDWVSSGTEDAVPFHLAIQAHAVPVEEELKRALPPDAQFVWEELRPAGTIDRIEARLERKTADAPVAINVVIREDRSTNAATGRSLGLRPRSFPYFLNDVDCEVVYRPGEVVIHHAEGSNGSTRMAVTGICTPQADGRWRAAVEWLPQTRLSVGSELLKALPESIRTALVKAEFRGPVHLLGGSEIVFANSSDDEMETSWDCKLAIEDGQLGDGKTIGAMRGTLWMRGMSRGSSIRASGVIAMDALTVLGIPVTRLKGPFAILGSNLYFGSRVADVLPPVDKRLATDLTAQALSGQVQIGGHARMDVGKLYLDGTLRSARLSLLMQDLGVPHSDVEAHCDADLHFAGIPWNPHTYSGNGRIHLSDANIYQLPFMIRLLRAAAVRPDDDSAFHTADIHFDIDGDRLPLQVACDGDVLRLRGEGVANLRREIDLDLYAYVGRRFPGSQALQQVMSESRFATFMLIQVNGTIDNPEMQRRAFPQIEATFQQIFPELAEQRRNNRILPWRR